MKIAFYTLGCKVNIYDTESVSELFLNNGFARVEFAEKADVYIINTCTVTNNSDSKSRKIIRQAIRNNPNACIVVMGCYAQVSSEELAEIAGVDIIVGTKNRSSILTLVKEVMKDRKQINAVTKLTDKFDDLTVKKFKNNTRAFLKIQDGCNNFCSYCIIPYARGRIVSKPFLNVIDEAKQLVNNGFKEIILSGIHTGKYGVDINSNLTKLITELVKIPDLVRLRISSIEINELTDELINLVKTNKKIANHLHIPLQSGSNQVLKDMNRKYTRDMFISTVNKIRSQCKDISLTADVIVGYPTETEELFLETYETIEKIGFSELHIFPFSKRNGTPAAKLKDLDNQIKKARLNKLMDLNEKLALSYVNKFLNKEVDLLVETNSDGSVGHTSNYLKVRIPEKVSKNSYLTVKIVEAGYPKSKAVIR